MQINSNIILDNNKLDFLLNNVNCGIAIINQDGYFLMSNKYFSDMLGYTLDDILEQNCIELALPQYQDKNKRIMQEINIKGEFNGFEKECFRRDGVIIWVNMNIIKIDEDQFLIVSNNITLEKELEKKVEEQILDIRDQQEVIIEQSRFVAMGDTINMIAHQWRQPLALLGTIVGNIKLNNDMGLLDYKLLDDKVKLHSSTLMHLTKTINDFSKYIINSQNHEEVTIKELIETPYRLIESLFLSYSIDCNINYEIPEDTIVNMIQSKFNQVLLSILNNSLDELIEKDIKKANVNIVLKEGIDLKGNSTIIIKIYDNGKGIPSDILANIFDPYFSTKSKNVKGIGLYMAKVIVEKHLKGKIIVSNNLSGGALVRISLPK